MIPPLDKHGLLPEGVWDCTLEEIATRFVVNNHRQHLWNRLQAWIADEYPKLLNAALFIDGSFCGNKELPDDIDVVVDLSVLPDAAALPILIELRLRHNEIKAKYGLDVWPKHPQVPNDLSAFFQYLGVKAAVDLGLSPNDPKGILRVYP